MVVAAIFSNDKWTFWDVTLLFFLFIPLLMIWFFTIFDVFRRWDLSGLAKAAWLLAVIVFPWIGTFAYLVFRPWGQPSYVDTRGFDSMNQDDKMQALSRLYASGQISDQEYEALKSRTADV